MKSGMYRVVCPSCKKESLENNDKFDPAMLPNGTMFRQVDGVKVRSPHDALPNVKGQNFQCPMCMMPLVTVSGRLRLRDVETGEAMLSDRAQDKPEMPKEDPKPEKKPVKRRKRKIKC